MPMGANGGQELGGDRWQAGDEIAGRLCGLTVDLAVRCDFDQAMQAGPLFVVIDIGQDIWVGQRPALTGLNPSMAFVHRPVVVGGGGRDSLLEGSLDILE